MKDYKKILEEQENTLSSFYIDDFRMSLDVDFEEYHISSPIEKVLYSALLITKKILRHNDIDPEERNGILYIHGISIVPQYKIGKYRCDFLVTYALGNNANKGKQIENKVIIECDSQEFHDTTEKQRRYEKTRDRFLQSKGYTVFRYTGKEILEDSFSIATEIISFLTNTDKDENLAIVRNY